MSRKIYPKEMIQFAADHCDGISNKQLADLINKEFDYDMTADRVKNMMQRNHIRRAVPASRIGQGKKTPEDVEKFIMGNYVGIGPQEMAKIVQEKFGWDIDHGRMKSLYGRLHIRSGLTGQWGERDPNAYEHEHKPNSGNFKKGNVPKNKQQIGTITARNEYDGTKRLWIKVGPNRWQEYARYIWERERGKIPRGMNVVTLNGNKTDIRIENLCLMSNSEKCPMVIHKRIDSNPEITKAYLSITRIESKLKEIKDERKG